MARRPVDLGRTDAGCSARWHGTVSAYRWGCTCPQARNARRVHDKRRREGRHVSPLVDATGTARRIRALGVMGWRYIDLAQRLGCTWQRVQQMACGKHPQVTGTTAAAVRDLCRRISAKPGPSPEAARRAVAKGWHGFGAWDDIDNPAAVPELGEPHDELVDEVAVRRAVHGDPTVVPRLTRAERDRAALAMLADGVGITAVAAQLRIGERRLRVLRDEALEPDGAAA